MQAIFGFIVNDGPFFVIDHAVHHFLATISGQCVHVFDVFVGQTHAALITDPIPVFSQIGLHFGPLFGTISPFVKVGEPAPVLGDHNLRAFEAVIHVVGKLETAARLLGITVGLVDHRGQ
ncbi:MAG: hypothetical protein ACD_62C00328G0003 [uncultured bacterium]|nr:MAG: hypothetical protein ACD_62C00328G0003 [uncultured bacterium]